MRGVNKLVKTNILKEFELKHNCFMKANNSFWEYVNSWKVDEPDEFFEAFTTFDLSELILEKGKISLVINYRFDKPIEYVQTTLNVIFMDKSFAEYRLLQRLNGEIMDDGLSFK